MEYKVVVTGYDSGLNELLHNQGKRYDARTKRYRVFNKEKEKNDRICRNCIRVSDCRNVQISKPVYMEYSFFVPNKKHDRSNYASAFIKSFEDALQQCNVIKNDTYDLVLDYTIHFEVDTKNPRVEVVIHEVEKGRKEIKQ